MARAVANEKEEEYQLAERCHAAGKAAMTQYWEPGGEAAAVGHHRPPCEFAKAERGVASFDVANMVGCTCGYFAEQEKIRNKKKKRKKESKQHNE